jgi:hypothetical protein
MTGFLACETGSVIAYKYALAVEQISGQDVGGELGGRPGGVDVVASRRRRNHGSTAAYTIASTTAAPTVHDIESAKYSKPAKAAAMPPTPAPVMPAALTSG